jgi:hypothetical protein
MNMTGYKTFVTGGVFVVSGVATMMGVTLDAEAVKTIVENIDVVVGGIMALSGAVMMVLRAFTNSPMFRKF